MWQMEEILKVHTGFFSSQRTVDGRPAMTNESLRYWNENNGVCHERFLRAL